MANEAESTLISVDQITWQAIQDFETRISSEGTQALQDEWSIFKNRLQINLKIQPPEDTSPRPVWP